MVGVRDILLLLQFAEVAETLSFSEAGRRLGVAQPWLSARIRKLEDLMGAQLFTRTSRRVELTPHGRELFDLVLPLARTANEVDAQLASWKNGVAGRVRVGCPPLGEPDRQQAELVARFIAANPKIEVDIETGWFDQQIQLMERGNLDLILAVRGAPPANAQSIALHRLTFAVMVHDHDPLASVADLTVAMFAGRRLAMAPPRRMGDLYDLLYAPFVHAGAVPVVLPELRRSLLQNDDDLIVSTIVPMSGAGRLRHGIVRRVVADVPPLWLMLLRPDKAVPSGATERFWNLARHLSSAVVSRDEPPGPSLP
jgi:DNA-binding transcriptional LysR family regulator